MRSRITGHMIGYTWYGHKEICPLYAEVDDLPETISDLQKFNNVKFTGIIGASIHVYPYTTISGVVYRSVEPVKTYKIGEFNTETDPDSMIKIKINI